MPTIGGFEFQENNKEEIMELAEFGIAKALVEIGLKVEKYAKALCPVGTVESTGKKGYRGGTLRNSITFDVDESKNEVTIGSNVEYAPYVELGTGPYFTPPPEWEKFDVPSPSGIGSGYVRPRPYLKPAVVEHLQEYKDIFEKEMKNA